MVEIQLARCQIEFNCVCSKYLCGTNLLITSIHGTAWCDMILGGIAWCYMILGPFLGYNISSRCSRPLPTYIMSGCALGRLETNPGISAAATFYIIQNKFYQQKRRRSLSEKLIIPKSIVIVILINVWCHNLKIPST